ncbi:HAD family hydrolase [Brevibacillus laterosporus]|uniref:HAD family hydrolase n=1 Tax=Brevibacillus laterosporus TaxID=1465 RepID=UPI001E00EB0A|nr:HAD-IIB family hydrolase [Brevibacillus laterosporus]MBM7111658.1 putative phosphatase YwpJ [Brevibacillus laterosporus]
MSYKVIFFDMDGTLLNEQKQIPEDTREALRQLQESGIHTVIATGRSPFHVRELAEDLGIDTLVYRGKPIVLLGADRLYFIG